MKHAPDAVPNVWAGDAIRFDAPVGNFRRPGAAAYAIAVAFCAWATALGMLSQPRSSGSEMSIVVACVLGVLLIAEIGAMGNRLVARRVARRINPATLGELATLCWLNAMASGVGRRGRFNAAEWLRRTGDGDPRVVLREVRLSPIPVEGAVNEEEPIDATSEQHRGRRRNCMVALVIHSGFVAFRIWLGFRTGTLVMTLVQAAVYVPLILFLLWRLGYLGSTLRPLSAYPGVVRSRTARKAEEFTRSNSVLLIEPAGTSEASRAWIIRDDGVFARMEFSLGAADPMLARLLIRWSWRGGEGARWTDQPMRDTTPLDAPFDSPVQQGVPA